MSNDLFCRNATCPCLDYPGCKTSAVEDRPAAKLCDCNQGRLPCTCKTQTADRLAYLDKLLPQVAEITHYLSQNSLGTPGEDCLPRALELIKKGRTQEAELYAAQDQVAGLQELMRTQRAPENLDVAVRHLVAAAEADDCHQGSPEHGHRLAGRWDGDNKHPKGSPCEECAAWDTLRKYVATDVAAEAQVIEDARVTQLLATLKRADGIISMLMPGAAKFFNLDIMELNEGMMEIAQALANEKGSAQ